MKKLKLDYARESCFKWNPPAYIKENNLNICVIILSLEINNGYDSISRYSSPILRSMSNKGYKIHIIDLAFIQSDSGAGIIRSLNNKGQYIEASREELLKYFPENMEIYRIFNAMMKDRQQDILDLICKINPLCIFDFSDEFSSISYYYSQNYPTFHFPMRKQGHAGSNFFHKYIIMQGEEDVKAHPPIAEEQVIRLPVFIETVQPLREFKREEYGLSEDDIVIVTVGNRLQYEIPNELIEQMCELLHKNKKVKWFLVGCAELFYLRNNHEELIGSSVYFVEYEKDLPGFYRICDIYLNPPRTGGGTSIAWAMQQGVTIVSATGGDAELNYIGKNNCVQSGDDLIPYIEKLLKNSTLLKQQKEKSIEISKKWDKDVFADKLIYEVNEFVKYFR
jgi:glycosyltransferase involved in cell wall biosynthesis